MAAMPATPAGPATAPDHRALHRAAHLARRLIPATWRHHVRLAMVEWMDLSWTTATGVTVQVTQYEDWVVLGEVFLSGEYDRAIDRALAVAAGRPGPLQVLDLGANVGFFTLRAVDRARRHDPGRAVHVTAVEPHQESVRRFERQVFDRSGLRGSVTLLQGLVGERRGKSALRGPSRISASVVGAAPGVPGPVVAYVDLDRATHALDRIDLLKSDIEGSELDFLRAYPDLLAKVQVAVFELHHTLCDTAACLALLRSYGLKHQDTQRADAETSIVIAER